MNSSTCLDVNKCEVSFINKTTCLTCGAHDIWAVGDAGEKLVRSSLKDRQTDSRVTATDRQADRQTDTHTHTHTQN